MNFSTKFCFEDAWYHYLLFFDYFICSYFLEDLDLLDTLSISFDYGMCLLYASWSLHDNVLIDILQEQIGDFEETRMNDISRDKLIKKGNKESPYQVIMMMRDSDSVKVTEKDIGSVSLSYQMTIICLRRQEISTERWLKISGKEILTGKKTKYNWWLRILNDNLGTSYPKLVRGSTELWR